MPTLLPANSAHHETCAVALTAGMLGLHCGIMYAVDAEPRQILHLRWHLELVSEVVPSEGWFLVPSALKRVQKAAVITRAALVAARHRDGSVPYGFGLEGVHVLDDGTIEMEGGIGVTCAALIQVICASVRVPLLYVPSWDEQSSPARKKEDADGGDPNST